MSHWSWQTSFIMILTVASRDILWQSMNVTLATERILLLYHLRKFSNFLRHFNKDLKKRIWETSQKNTLSTSLHLLGLRRWQRWRLHFSTWGEHLGKWIFTRENSTWIILETCKQYSLHCHQLSLDGSNSFGISKIPQTLISATSLTLARAFTFAFRLSQPKFPIRATKLRK